MVLDSHLKDINLALAVINKENGRELRSQSNFGNGKHSELHRKRVSPINGHSVVDAI